VARYVSTNRLFTHTGMCSYGYVFNNNNITQQAQRGRRRGGGSACRASVGEVQVGSSECRHYGGVARAAARAAAKEAVARAANWPLDDIVMTNVVWCMAH